MCRGVNLGDNLYAQAFGQLLKLDELFLCVVTVACSEAGEVLALEAERALCLVPIVSKVLLERVVVKVNLECVHLVVRHKLHIVLKHV